HKAKPATAAQRLMQRSAASHRSAIWPQTRGARTDPMAAVDQINAVCRLVKLSDLRYGPNTGDHAPTMAYCKNIITDRRTGKASSFLASVNSVRLWYNTGDCLQMNNTRAPRPRWPPLSRDREQPTCFATCTRS